MRYLGGLWGAACAPQACAVELTMAEIPVNTLFICIHTFWEAPVDTSVPLILGY